LKLSVKNYQRIVVKLGASLFCPRQGALDTALVSALAGSIAKLIKDGLEIILVSSGAIAIGMNKLKLHKRPRELDGLQAAAAIGQPELMGIYQRFFRGHAITCAQVLLTWEDFLERRRYLNAKNTLLKLLKLGCLPIINENDTVSVDEIKFGDNDRLSALVASLVSADLLVILSDVDGLWGKDKLIIPVVEEITPAISCLARPTDKQSCAGGMVTKIEAAKICVNSGIPCIIANGRKKDILSAPEGTLFLPKKALAARKRWIAYSSRTGGRITVDEGARRALLNKKSLLAVGVAAVEGNFESGEIVSLVDCQGKEFARGKVCFSCRQLAKSLGKRMEKEVVHCDNIVLLWP